VRVRAFSLIELAAVLLVLAVVAAAVTLRVAGPMHRAGMNGLVAEIVSFDRLTRTWSVEQDAGARLVVDLSEGRLRRTDERGRAQGAAMEVPSGYRLGRVLVGGENRSGGRTAVPVSRHGLARSYAILVEGPGRGQRWILMAGLTGQHEVLDDERKIREVLALLETRGDAG